MLKAAEAENFVANLMMPTNVKVRSSENMRKCFEKVRSSAETIKVKEEVPAFSKVKLRKKKPLLEQ